MNRPPNRIALFPLHVEAEQDFDRLFVGRTNELNAIRQALTEQRGAAISGVRGSGKTSVLYTIEQEARAQFPGGIALVQGQGLFRGSLVAEVQRQIDIPPRGRALIIVDDVHALSLEQTGELDRLLAENKAVKYLLAGDAAAPLPIAGGKVISLGGLSQQEYYQLLNQRVHALGADAAIARQLWEATSVVSNK